MKIQFCKSQFVSNKKTNSNNFQKLFFLKKQFSRRKKFNSTFVKVNLSTPMLFSFWKQNFKSICEISIKGIKQFNISISSNYETIS